MSSTRTPMTTRRNTHDVSPCRAISVDLWFTDTTEDLMTIFVDCLVRLPNLRTLDVFSTNRIGLVTKGLQRECAKFPSIRGLWASSVPVLFKNCPNVESATASGGLFPDVEVLCVYGKRVRRFAGVHKHDVWRGELRDTSLSEAPIHQRHRGGSRKGLSGSPGNLHQGYNYECPCAACCRKSTMSRTHGAYTFTQCFPLG